MDSVKGYWKSFWEKREIPGSQNDLFLQKLSLNAVLRFLRHDENVLSVGCGDGYGFDKYAERVGKLVGIDYSTGAVDKAGKKYRSLIEQGKLSFAVGNILEKEPEYVGKFDAVITERCLCNMKTAINQKKALEIIKDYLKPSGRAIICEPSLQGYDAVDKVRAAFGLVPLKRHWHNILFDERIVNECEFFEKKERYTFGVYTLISRVFHPLLVHPDEPRFDSDINRIAAEICKVVMADKGYSDIPSQHVLYVLQRVK